MGFIAGSRSQVLVECEALLSPPRCHKARRQRREKKTTCEKYLSELARIGVNKKFVKFNKLNPNTVRVTVADQKYGQTS